MRLLTLPSSRDDFYIILKGNYELLRIFPLKMYRYKSVIYPLLIGLEPPDHQRHEDHRFINLGNQLYIHMHISSPSRQIFASFKRLQDIQVCTMWSSYQSFPRSANITAANFNQPHPEFSALPGNSSLAFERIAPAEFPLHSPRG